MEGRDQYLGTEDDGDEPIHPEPRRYTPNPEAQQGEAFGPDYRQERGTNVAHIKAELTTFLRPDVALQISLDPFEGTADIKTIKVEETDEQGVYGPETSKIRLPSSIGDTTSLCQRGSRFAAISNGSN